MEEFELSDAVALSECLKRDHYAPEQVQDFYPTPGTASTVMYYTGIDPLSMKKVFVATDPEQKQLQRALLQCNRPENAALVRKALRLAGREDLIGFAPTCLVRPESAPKRDGAQSTAGKREKTQNAPKRGEKNTKFAPKNGKVAPAAKGKPAPKGSSRPATAKGAPAKPARGAQGRPAASKNPSQKRRK